MRGRWVDRDVRRGKGVDRGAISKGRWVDRADVRRGGGWREVM